VWYPEAQLHSTKCLGSPGTNRRDDLSYKGWNPLLKTRGAEPQNQLQIPRSHNTSRKSARCSPARS